MATEVWKFTLPESPGRHVIQSQFKLSEPKFLLTAQVQNGVPVLWALCDRSAPTSEIVIDMVMTGQETKHELGEYIGTVQLEYGKFVLHVFRVLL